MLDLIFDNADFARKQKTISGAFALGQLERVKQEVLGGSPITIGLAGGVDASRRFTLDLAISGLLELQCRRCLQGMTFELDVATRFILFPDEERLDAAERDDEDLEGLLFDQHFHLVTLIEDEILLTLPFAPTHDGCTTDGLADATVITVPKPNPFAVLADLRDKLKRDQH